MDEKYKLTKAFLEQVESVVDEKLVEKKQHQFWYNTRKKDKGSLRLTDYGYKYVIHKVELKEYKVEFPEDFTVTPQILLWLDEFIISPYYLHKRHISVFKESSAFELYLFSGDIRKYGYAKALAKRTNHF
jgi:hypothetical protein